MSDASGQNNAAADPVIDGGGGAASAASTVPLAHHAARGFAWVVFQAAATKIISLTGQLILAYLLAPNDFGVVQIAYTLTAFSGFAQNLGLAQILVQRQGRMAEIQNAAFWMGLAGGVITGLIYTAGGPIAAAHYGHAELPGLMALLGLTAVFDGLDPCPLARLQIDLRFRALGVMNLGTSVLQSVLTVVLAALKFGPYSFVLPRPIVAAVQAALLWRVAPVSVKWRMDFRMWRALAPSVVFLAGTAWITMVGMQSAAFAMSLFCSVEEVGLFSFAYNLSTQVLQLIMVNTGSAFLPVFSRMGDDQPRQVAAFLRAGRLICAIAVPLCLLQAATSEDVIRAMFDRRWLPAAPLTAMLSVGMSFMVIAGMYDGLLQAQGRFEFIFWRVVVCALSFLGIAIGAAFVGGATLVSLTFAGFQAVMWPVVLGIVLRWGGGRFWDGGRVYVRSLAGYAACLALTFGWIWLTGYLPTYGAEWLAAHLGAIDRVYAFLHMVCVAGLSAPLYVLVLRFLDRAAFVELQERLDHFLRGRLGWRVAPQRRG